MLFALSEIMLDNIFFSLKVEGPTGGGQKGMARGGRSGAKKQRHVVGEVKGHGKKGSVDTLFPKGT